MQDPSLRNDDFIILQLLDRTNCLDRDATLVQGVPFGQSGEQVLDWEDAAPLVLQEPDNGWPPVFSVPELPYYCFSEEAKQACDKAGLKGLWWRPQR